MLSLFLMALDGTIVSAAAPKHYAISHTLERESKHAIQG
jgi:hypothetical protein